MNILQKIWILVTISLIIGYFLGITAPSKFIGFIVMMSSWAIVTILLINKK